MYPRKHVVDEYIKSTLLPELNGLTGKIISCAIEVHRNLGPGLLESIYEASLCHEFELRNIAYERQLSIPVVYKGYKSGDFRIDLIVEKKVILELKSVSRLEPVFEAQLLSYLKLMNRKVGLLINLNVPILKDCIKRIIL